MHFCFLSVTIPVTTTCSNGLEGVQDSEGIVCCNPACGVCGGSECGGNPGLSTGDCCVGTILTSGESCNVTESAPCVLEVDVEGKLFMLVLEVNRVNEGQYMS